MKRRPRLTPVEWEIMEAIWSIGGSPSVRDILEHTFPKGRRAYTTIQTIMNNLERKGFLTRKKTGLVNFYTPVTSREEATRAETSNLVKRVFQGSFPALANHLINSGDLSLEEIRAIKRMLDKRARELGGKKR